MAAVGWCFIDLVAAVLSALQMGFSLANQVIMPIVMLLILGWYLRRRGQLEDSLIAGMNGIVYRYALPALLFFSVMKSESEIWAAWRMILASYLSVLTLFFTASALAKRFFLPVERGVFVQGVYRSNMAIVGLALVHSVYDGETFALAAVCTGATALLLNVLGVICLSQNSERQLSPTMLLWTMLHNPLIIALLLALPLKALQFKVPVVWLRFGDYLSHLTLPLALLCAGASFNLRAGSASSMAWWASLGKTVIAPMVFVLLGVLCGVGGLELGVLFLLGAAPAASAGYIMAKAIPGNDALAAANIIAISNLISLGVIAVGLAFFPVWGWR